MCYNHSLTDPRLAVVCRCVTTLLGRQLQHRLPPSPPPNASAAAVRARTNGERTAFSMYLQGCMADTVRAAAALLQSHVCAAPPQQQRQQEAADRADGFAATSMAIDAPVDAAGIATAGATAAAGMAEAAQGPLESAAAAQQAAQPSSQGPKLPPGAAILVYLGKEELVMQVQAAHVLPALEQSAACLQQELPALLLGRSSAAQQQAGVKLWWGGSMCLASANIYQQRRPGGGTASASSGR